MKTRGLWITRAPACILVRMFDRTLVYDGAKEILLRRAGLPADARPCDPDANFMDLVLAGLLDEQAIRRIASEVSLYSRLPVVLRCENTIHAILFARYYPGVVGLRSMDALGAERRREAESYAAVEVA